MARDPYQILGVTKEASQADIQKAYRDLAKKHHPDLNTGDEKAEQTFKEISAAYNILGDKDKRARYDRGEIDASGQERPEAQFYKQYAGGPGAGKYRGGFGGFGDFAGARGGEAGEEINIDDILSELFGGGGPGSGRGPGPGPGPGSGMGGHGPRARPGAGRGRSGMGGFEWPGEDVHYRLPVDFMEAARGARKRVTMPDGTSLEVNIPAGVEDGQVLRLKGKGRPGSGGAPAGNALVTIAVGSHKWFRREGLDLYLDLPITLAESVSSRKVPVPTLEGRVNLKIPEGAKSGRKMRLKGRGIAAARGGTGDLYVILEIHAPERPDKTLKSALEEWEQAHPYNPRRHFEGSP